MNVIYPPGVFNWTAWLNRRKVHRYDHLLRLSVFWCVCVCARVCNKKHCTCFFGFFLFVFFLSCQVHLVVYTLRICPKNVTAMHRSLRCVAGGFSVSCSHSVARPYFIIYIYIYFLRQPSMCHYFWPYFHM